MQLNLFGIPLSIDPFFFVVLAVLGGTNDVTELAIWVSIGCVAIIVHELGHALVYRGYGHEVGMALVSMGGLTYSLRGPRLGHGQRILVSLAGPVAGFVLGGLVFAAFAMGAGDLLGTYGDQVLSDALFVTVGWGLLNLLPIAPLDGGHVLQEVATMASPTRGPLVAAVVSLAVAGALALWAASYGQWFMVVLLALLAWQNVSVLRGGEAR